MSTSVDSVVLGLNTVWVVLTAAMVFFMEGGFALLEAGFVRGKNSISIMMKVFADCTLGMLAYWAVGFGLMYGASKLGWAGTSGFFLGGALEHLPNSIPPAAFWLFQMAFAVAAVSIVSGAVAERIKFSTYSILVVLFTALIYPLSGHWLWNPDGWLAKLGMLDFAGSAGIHAVGGWAALAAATVLGPRIGKYNPDGSANVMPPNNLPLAAAGTFILWFGWFGFNAGSTLSGMDINIARIAVTTNLAAAAGGVSATVWALARTGKADPSMTINGVLAGLVAITAGAAYVSPASAVLIGAVSGVLMSYALGLIDRLGVDDPVGAVAVHGVNGTFGTLALGLLHEQQGLLLGGGAHLFLVQALGVAVLSLWGFGATWLAMKALQATVGVRVSAQEEVDGLDLSQHGSSAYAGQTGITGTALHPSFLSSLGAGSNASASELAPGTNGD